MTEAEARLLFQIIREERPVSRFEIRTRTFVEYNVVLEYGYGKQVSLSDYADYERLHGLIHAAGTGENEKARAYAFGLLTSQVHLPPVRRITSTGAYVDCEQ